MRGVAWIVLALAAPLACRGRGGGVSTTTTPSTSSSSVASVASASASSSASGSASASALASIDPIASVPWTALVAAEAWEPAAQAMAAAPGKESSPAMRLGRVRVAVGRCTKDEGDVALRLIKSLREGGTHKPIEDVLAGLEVDALLCAERWADALAVQGPAALSARKGAAAAWTRARALEANGDHAGARAAVSGAIDGAANAGLPAGRLIAFRLKVLRAMPASVEITRAIDADRKKLFIEHPAAFDAAAKDGEPQTAPAMSGEDWLQRARALANANRPEDALHAIDAAASAGIPARKVARARGHALWAAKSWVRAGTLLQAAAAMANDEDANEDAFLAARAKSRAGDDPAAIVAYEALAKSKPGSRWGAEAAYLAAHLRYLAGNWKDALAAFDKYLQGPWAKAPNQEANVREAKRARAIALLEGGSPALARKQFHALVSESKESYPRARLELLEAIAAERGHDKAGAIAIYSRLSASEPWSWMDLAARARLSRLGETRAPWPSGPVAHASPPALDEDVRLLDSAGLRRDAYARLSARGLPKDDLARCSLFEAFDAGWDAYRTGLKFPLDGPPDAANGPRWRCAFPTPWSAIVTALEMREGIPRGLLHALLRQESGFRVEVVSFAGAVGVAQLMPYTAIATATPLGIHLDPTDIAALQAPYLQLDLAARHVHALFVELAGENADSAKKADAIPLVIAAYNGGSGAVKRWSKEAGTLDADVYVERIPFVETRGYVARVLGNLVRYAILEGAQTPSLPQKLPVP
ncbi:MAG: lytic transglycosylase domain-containing protein [Polyangiales bacterium]